MECFRSQSGYEKRTNQVPAKRRLVARVDRDSTVEEDGPTIHSRDDQYVLTLEEIANLAAEGGQPAETLMNVVALIARRFGTDVCSAYLLEPDRANLVMAATLGLRRECIGRLRMALHEGLAGRGGRPTPPRAG